MIGRADIEESKSNVAMNAWLPQASYPCGNFSASSVSKFDIFFFQAEDGIRDTSVTGVQTCALAYAFPSAMNNQLRTGADKGNPTV
mmetsp:Transcript_48624/g.73433  ORF Transcript_48624/g.73433 Transcript_48624/m.73433 type:complete len:86 (+) Transcript_48624:635-892(+)